MTEEAATKMTVELTLGILKACLDSKTVKRVVYTSSADRDKVDESKWSDIDFYKSQNRAAGTELYMATKVKTEKVALEFAEKHGLDVVTLIPSLVVDPFICHHLPASVGLALTVIFGSLAIFENFSTITLFMLEQLGHRTARHATPCPCPVTDESMPISVALFRRWQLEIQLSEASAYLSEFCLSFLCPTSD
ncbi:NAD(P)-binding domain containing protein [Parasponia andersonii]|uniref:NAD(P)-binding domain containing protein n=1 Tax=Parasponia andersonii TaxID=3476 RepID=A0A2P5BHX6_PARAD|nr:NAD(P)-binding domain containing protein [Parasponia andersonii]